MQALSTWITCDGIETCRRDCGGHGYSLLSGLPTLYTYYVQNATWEGDNNVLCLQASGGRFSDVAVCVNQAAQGLQGSPWCGLSEVAVSQSEPHLSACHTVLACRLPVKSSDLVLEWRVLN